MSDLLIELVRHYSPSGDEAPAVQYLTGWMRSHGLQAWIDAAGNACGQCGPDDAPHTLLLLGHIDTVPGKIPVRIEDQTLYGRGSVDAKGSLCAFAEAAARSHLPDGWRVIVIGAVEEEAATSRGARFVRDTFTPDLCIIGEPSGANRITLGYKGRLLVDYTLRRPVAHSSRPELTVGALGAAFWQAVQDWADQHNRGANRHFDQIHPSLRAINTSTDHFVDTLQMRIGFRLPPNFSPEQGYATISPFAEPDGELSAWGGEQAYLGDKNNALVRSMLSAIRAQGQSPGFVLKGGTSDMNVVGERWTCPMIAYGPGDSSLDHTPDEHIALDEYGQAVAVLQHVIEHLEA